MSFVGGNGAQINTEPHFNNPVEDIYKNPLARSLSDTNTLAESTDRTISTKRGGKRRISKVDHDGKSCDKCCTIF